MRGASQPPVTRRRGGEGDKESLGGAQVVVVKDLKMVKKPRASRPETRLGLEVSTLAVDSLLLHGLW